MKKILIIGSGGAGKSTFARRLHEIIGIKLIHLDKIYWQAGWIEPAKDIWRNKIEKILVEDEWIMDGNYSSTIDIRIAACDTIIFLDLPRATCLYRVIKRRLAYRQANRPDMAEGCHEKIDLEFLSWIWNYPKRTKAKLLPLLEEVKNEKKIFYLKSKKEVESFFMNFEK